MANNSNPPKKKMNEDFSTTGLIELLTNQLAGESFPDEKPASDEAEQVSEEETPIEEAAEEEETPIEEAVKEEETPVPEAVEEETPIEEVAEVEESPIEKVAEEEETPVPEVTEEEETPAVESEEEKQNLFEVLDSLAYTKEMSVPVDIGDEKVNIRVEAEKPYQEELVEHLDNTESIHAYEPDITVHPAEEIETDDKTDTGERAMDTEIMMSFGLDPRKLDSKDQPEQIFDEYALNATEQIDVSSIQNGSANATVEPKEEKEEAFEYTEPEQNVGIFDTFKKKYTLVKLRLFFSAFFAAALLILEAVPSIRTILGMTNYVLLDFGVTFLCAFFAIDRIIAGIVSLAHFKTDCDSITAFMFLLSVATTITALLVDSYVDLYLYNVTFAICVFFSTLSLFFGLRKEIYSFNIISSRKKKFVLSRLTREGSEAERMEFGNMITDSSDVYRLKTVGFVDGFFARKAGYPKAKKCLNFLIPFSFLLSVAALIVSLRVAGESVYQSVTNMYVTFLICAPVSAFISFAYSTYLATIRAYSQGSAILGDTTPDEYENASVLSVPDDLAFPPDRLRIRSVKVYENQSIEKVIYLASSVYSKIGGPLATVFRKAALDGTASDNVEIGELSELGVDALVDGHHVFVGQPSYMDAQCFNTTYEPGDELYDGDSNKRILYLAMDDFIVAKFYIQYNASSDFIYIVRHLAQQGICTAITTADPGLDNMILSKSKLDPATYPVKILKPMLSADEQERISAYTGSIVSTQDAKGLAKTWITCDRLISISKTNLAIKLISVIVGAVLMGLVIVTGHSDIMRPLYPAIYQLFWMIPMWLISKIYI
ncbi:MAG: hypothetical protein KBS76_03690 [Ruminococcus sp.]|nr:hypothetical protein [Candidatus Apopatosoma intestinale]